MTKPITETRSSHIPRAFRSFCPSNPNNQNQVSIDVFTVQCSLDKLAHASVEFPNVQVLVHRQNDVLDASLQLGSVLDDTKAPTAALQNAKDVLDWVEVRGVGRHVDVVDVVFTEEGL